MIGKVLEYTFQTAVYATCISVSYKIAGGGLVDAKLLMLFLFWGLIVSGLNIRIIKLNEDVKEIRTRCYWHTESEWTGESCKKAASRAQNTDVPKNIVRPKPTPPPAPPKKD